MKIVNFAVKRPVAISILVAVVIIFGFFTLAKIPLDLYPEMKFPYAGVITSYPGAGPEEVEQVSQVMEGVLNTLSGVKRIQSQSTSGNSLILIEYNWGTNIESALMDIREKIGLIETYLPSGVEKPMILKMDPNMMPIMQMGIQGGDKISLGQLQSIAEDVIEPRLSRIPEVASVVVTGGLEREIKVEIDPVKLEDYGISLSQVNQILQMENFNISGGKAREGEREYYIRSLQQFENLDDIRNVAILTPRGDAVYLNDIALIKDGHKDDSQITRVNSSKAVGIHCLKQSDANTVKACAAVKKEMEKIMGELDMDIDFSVAMDQSAFINQSLDMTKRMMIEGALLAILVLFLFLRNGRSTLIVFTAIPLSIIATFILIFISNSTLNLITMGGLALGIGRMVDDSIVVFENIYRHRSLGLPPIEAALTGASEVGNAVIASTTTIIAVFFPIMFAEGLASVLFRPLAITVSFAIFCSLLVALTIVPLLASRALTDKAMQPLDPEKGRISRVVLGFGHWLDNLGERYKKLLHWALGHRRHVVAIVTLLMIGAGALVPFIGAEFLPAMDAGEISITIENDKGTMLKATEAVVDKVEEQLREIPEVSIIFTSIGGSANMFFDSGTKTDQAAIYLKLVPKKERERSGDEVAEEIRNRLSGLAGSKIKVSMFDLTSSGPSGGGPVSVEVRGDDMQVLREVGDEVAEIVRKVPGTREVTSSLSDGVPEIQVKVDRKRAAAYGLTPMQVATDVRNAMQGTVATRYRVGGDEVDVRVRYSPQNHQELEYLENLAISTPAGGVLRLSQIASFEMAPGPIQITRVDRVRRAEVNAYLLNRDLSVVMKDVQDEVGKINLPAGYNIEYGGQNKDMMDSFRSLGIALILAIILVYAVMAIQYESFFNPFVIMFSVPTAFIGVVLGLLLTNKAFSVTAFIGIIMLVGIVVANAIVLVDYLKQLRDRGMVRDEAIIEAGKVRLRPILMTAFATILAMLPLALGMGEGAEAEAPLAIVIIFGLLVSTFITLVLVPVVYSIFDDWGQRFKTSWDERLDGKQQIDA